VVTICGTAGSRILVLRAAVSRMDSIPRSGRHRGIGVRASAQPEHVPKHRPSGREQQALVEIVASLPLATPAMPARSERQPLERAIAKALDGQVVRFIFAHYAVLPCVRQTSALPALGVDDRMKLQEATKAY
jgi:hypothetical protein